MGCIAFEIPKGQRINRTTDHHNHSGLVCKEAIVSLNCIAVLGFVKVSTVLLNRAHALKTAAEKRSLRRLLTMIHSDGSFSSKNIAQSPLVERLPQEIRL